MHAVSSGVNDRQKSDQQSTLWTFFAPVSKIKEINEKLFVLMSTVAGNLRKSSVQKKLQYFEAGQHGLKPSFW